MNENLACLDFETCQGCANATIKNFQCSWCDPKKDPKLQNLVEDIPEGAFCIDQIGLNRWRREWVEGDDYSSNISNNVIVSLKAVAQMERSYFRSGTTMN